MINLLDALVLCSAAAYLVSRLLWERREKNWRLFAFETLGVLLLLTFLHWCLGMFDFSNVEKGAGDSEDLVRLALLYFWMVMGMLGQYIYSWLMAGERMPFRTREFLATCFIAPAVFIPFYNTVKSSWTDASMRWLVYFVAYENGFFFKNTLDQRSEAYGVRRSKVPH
jgi:hypothetical protein